MDVVPFHFVVGAVESGDYHGMGDRLGVRKCGLYSYAPSP